ncbi:MAG: hypothetical protein H7Y11_09845, partial [Armatimonadetes bacterium]|nr:hypothetical protein [Anaerolineae bacterium]
AADNTQIPGPPLQTEVSTGPLNQGYRFITAQSSAVWQAAFFNGSTDLGSLMTIDDFSLEFVFANPSSLETCRFVLAGADVPATETPISPTLTPSHTPFGQPTSPGQPGGE